MTIHPLVMPDGVHILSSPYVSDWVEKKRTWRERLFTRPWKPWVKWKRVKEPKLIKFIESPPTFFCSVETYCKLKQSITEAR